MFPLSFRAEAIKGQSNDLTQMLPHSTQSVKMLAAEARSTTKAVRSLLEMECKQLRIVSVVPVAVLVCYYIKDVFCNLAVWLLNCYNISVSRHLL